MINFLSVQFSIFGVFSGIEATSENILKIMESLKDESYLPNTVVNQNVDIDSKTIEVESRISFVTKDQKCNFVILNDRIDFNYNFLNVTPQSPEDTFDELKDNSNRILSMIMSLFKVKASRFAINISVLGSEPIDDKISYYYKKCIKGFDYYTEREIAEWDHSTNSRVNVDISNKPEILNVITNLSMAINSNNKERRLLCHFDINTIGENTIQRFGVEELSSFTETARPIIMELINNFKEVEKNE